MWRTIKGKYGRANAGHKRKQLPSVEARSHRPISYPPSSTLSRQCLDGVSQGCLLCSSSTWLTCRDQQDQSSRSAMLMTYCVGPMSRDYGPHVSLNSYQEECLQDNSLLISVPKVSVMLLTPDSQLPLVQCLKILGVYVGISLSFNKQKEYPSETISSRPWQVHPGDNKRKHY